MTDIRKEIVTLLWLTVRDTTLAKGFRLGHEGQGYKLSVSSEYRSRLQKVQRVCIVYKFKIKF